MPVWPHDTTSNLEARSFSAVNSYDGYTTFDLVNKGTGRNYGLELTMEKFFTGNNYFMATTSLYESKFTAIDDIERNTIFNGNYIFNLLGGKEFVFNDGRKVLSLNGRLIYAGGKRETPIDLAASRDMGYTVRDYSRRFETKLPDYFRMDVGISYKRNRPRAASVIAINVQNVLGYENVAYHYYGPITDKVLRGTQLGMFPNLSYKIEF